MSLRVIHPATRRHILIFDKDWDALRQLVSGTSCQPGTLIRSIVHEAVKKVKTKVEQGMDTGKPQEELAGILGERDE